MEPRHGIALIVDGDNVAPQILAPLVAYLEKRGNVTYRKAFRNWRSTRDAAIWDDATKRLAFERIDRYRTTEGKNASDIAVVVQCMDLFFDGIRDFCIASGDTDFAPLVERLRRGGSKVTVVGHKPDGGLLAEIADEYLPWTSLEGAPAKRGRTIAKKVAPQAPAPPAQSAPPGRGRRPSRAKQANKPAASAPAHGRIAQEKPAKRAPDSPKTGAANAGQPNFPPGAPPPRPNGGGRKTRPKPEPRGAGAPGDLVVLLNDAYQVAMTDGEVDPQGWVPVDKLGMILQSLDKEFTPARFGYGSRTPLSRLFQRVPGFEVQPVRRGKGMQYRVRPRK